MNVVFVRLDKLKGVEKLSSKLTYQLLVELKSPDEAGSAVPIIIKDISRVKNEWTFPYAYSQLTSIIIQINITDPVNRLVQPISRLELPLDWFPSNLVVREKYPMRCIDNKVNKITARITVHRSENGQDAFAAPKGQLNVTPAWKEAKSHGHKQNYQPQGQNPIIPPAPMQYQYQNQAFVQQKTQPPIGIPPIKSGPAPQIFTVQIPSQPLLYYGYPPAQQQMQMQQQPMSMPQQNVAKRPPQSLQPPHPVTIVKKDDSKGKDPKKRSESSNPPPQQYMPQPQYPYAPPPSPTELSSNIYFPVQHQGGNHLDIPLVDGVNNGSYYQPPPVSKK